MDYLFRENLLSATPPTHFYIVCNFILIPRFFVGGKAKAISVLEESFPVCLGGKFLVFRVDASLDYYFAIVKILTSTIMSSITIPMHRRL